MSARPEPKPAWRNRKSSQPIKAREKALNESPWGKFCEREHDAKPRSFKWKDTPTLVTTDEYRAGWDLIFGGKKEAV